MAPRPRTAVLRVDLTGGDVSRERLPDAWRRKFLGGKGLGARYLYEHVPAGADPLGPENVLGFVLGPLSGYLPGETRYVSITRSPLTGAFLDSYGGGSFPDVLAGARPSILGVFVTGRADEPVVLEIDESEARLRPADDLWGCDAAETDAAFPSASVACVGPAGENQVRYATIATDGGDHQAGRGGAGAVMGAKRLKAVVVRGGPPTPSEDLRALRERYADAYSEDDTGRWQAAGETVESVDFADEVGVLATRGWQENSFEGVESIGIEATKAAATGRERDDDRAPGGFTVETDEGEGVPRGGTMMSLGAGLGIDDFDDVAALGTACDRLGMDVISAGNAVAWAAHAAADGRIDRDVDFGDADAARELVGDIAARSDSVADALADGVDAAADRFGGGESIPTVKSMELPAYDPRGALAMALAYATSDRGGCHRRARPIEEEVFDAEGWSTARRVRAVVGAQNARSVLWSLVVDDFVGEALAGDLGAEWLSAVGLEYTHEELARAGERIWNLVRLFNAREEFDREDDRLPEAFVEPASNGAGAGPAIDPADFETLLDAYYEMRGWDENGLPTDETLRRLDLTDL